MSINLRTSAVYENYHLYTDVLDWDFELCGDAGDTEDLLICFDYDDIPGLYHAVAKQDIGTARELIDAYLKNKIGYIPDYKIYD